LAAGTLTLRAGQAIAAMTIAADSIEALAGTGSLDLTDIDSLGAANAGLSLSDVQASAGSVSIRSAGAVQVAKVRSAADAAVALESGADLALNASDAVAALTGSIGELTLVAAGALGSTRLLTGSRRTEIRAGDSLAFDLGTSAPSTSSLLLRSGGSVTLAGDLPAALALELRANDALSVTRRGPSAAAAMDLGAGNLTLGTTSPGTVLTRLAIETGGDLNIPANATLPEADQLSLRAAGNLGVNRAGMLRIAGGELIAGHGVTAGGKTVALEAAGGLDLGAASITAAQGTVTLKTGAAGAIRVAGLGLVTATTITAEGGVDLRLRTDASTVSGTLSAAANALGSGTGSIRIDDIGSVTVARAGASGSTPGEAPGDVRLAAEGDLRLESAIAGGALLASAGGAMTVINAASGTDLSLDAAGASIEIGRVAAGRDLYLSLSAPMGSITEPVIRELSGAGADADADLVAGTRGSGGKLHFYRTTSADAGGSNGGQLRAPFAGQQGSPALSGSPSVQTGNALASAGAFAPTIWTLSFSEPGSIVGEYDLAIGLIMEGSPVSLLSRIDFTGLNAAGVAARAAQALRAANLPEFGQRRQQHRHADQCGQCDAGVFSHGFSSGRPWPGLDQQFGGRPARGPALRRRRHGQWLSDCAGGKRQRVRCSVGRGRKCRPGSAGVRAHASRAAVLRGVWWPHQQPGVPAQHADCGHRRHHAHPDCRGRNAERNRHRERDRWRFGQRTDAHGYRQRAQ
jgi:hypothetical protein